MTLPMLPAWLPLLVLGLALLALIAASVALSMHRRSIRRQPAVESEPELRSALLRATADLALLTERVSTLEAEVGHLRNETEKAMLVPGMVRFLAFDGDEPPVSFSMALVNARRDGVILTSLHARDRSRLYAKLVANGTAESPLSEEETEAMHLAGQAASADAPAPRRHRRGVR